MPSPVLAISDADRAILESWARSRSVPTGHVERARIVLAAADGAGTSGTARLLGCPRPTVIKWRDRFAAHGIAGLDDEPRSGRPKVVEDAAIIAATLEPPPDKLGVTQLGIGDATVARAWRKHHVKPWRRETFKFSTDPELEVFFGIITRQAIRRGSFDSVKQLATAIRTFIKGWNDRCHPFTWTKTADEILPHATRKRDSDARH